MIDEFKQLAVIWIITILILGLGLLLGLGLFFIIGRWLKVI